MLKTMDNRHFNIYRSIAMTIFYIWAVASLFCQYKFLPAIWDMDPHWSIYVIWCIVFFVIWMLTRARLYGGIILVFTSLRFTWECFPVSNAFNIFTLFVIVVPGLILGIALIFATYIEDRTNPADILTDPEEEDDISATDEVVTDPESEKLFTKAHWKKYMPAYIGVLVALSLVSNWFAEMWFGLNKLMLAP